MSTSWGVSNEVLQILIVLLIAIVAYFLKGVLAEIKAIKTGQQTCQLSLVRDYQLKQDADEDSERQWVKLDEHGQAIATCNQKHASHEKRLDRLELGHGVGR